MRASNRRQDRPATSNRLVAYFLHHMQSLVFSLGKIYQSPATTLMTVAVIGITLSLPGGFYLFLSKKNTSQNLLDAWDRMALKAPVVGEIATKSAIARFARTLETMSAAGVPLVEAMESVAGATGNIIYHDASLKIKDEVSQGTQLQTSMRNTGLFPNMAIQMVSIGEEAGSLDAMLAKVADFYETEVDNAVDALTSLLEPIIMAVLGVLVGGLIIAMYLPIFKLGAVV
jgi:type IV pilus assembly protein PilC